MSPRDAISRSEEVRRRRAELARQRQQRARVESRAPVQGRSARASRVSRPAARRRYDIAVGLPGTRLRVPALPRIEFGWRWISSGLITLLCGLMYVFWTSPTFRVGEAELVGAQRVGAAELNQTLDIGGRSVFGLVPSRLTADLYAAFPEFSRVRVSINLPNQVRVTVVERQPVLRWELNSSVSWIDADGYKFSERGEFAGLIPVLALSAPPELEAFQGSPVGAVPPYVTPSLVASLRQLAVVVPAGTPILYDANYGMGWQDDRGWLAYIGREPGDLEMKMRVYWEVSNALSAQGTRPVIISVEYPDAPYYRFEQ